MVVWNIFYLHPYLGKLSNLTNIFQRGWNHQLVFITFHEIRGLLIACIKDTWHITIQEDFYRSSCWYLQFQIAPSGFEETSKEWISGFDAAPLEFLFEWSVVKHFSPPEMQFGIPVMWNLIVSLKEVIWEYPEIDISHYISHHIEEIYFYSHYISIFPTFLPWKIFIFC